MKATREWQLPDGRKVLVWAADVDALRADVALTGNAVLFREPGAEVYERIAPEDAHVVEPLARRIG